MTEEIVDVFHALQLRDCGRPLSTSVLADWERAIGCRLPGEYRRFLEVFNGGGFYPRFFGFVYPLHFTGTTKLPPTEGVGIFTFLSLNEPWNWRDLQWIRDVQMGRIPEGSIPIANAATDLILLDCRRDGEITLWLHDCESDVAPEENRIPLAKSFLEFARGIQREPREAWLRRSTAVEEPFISIQLHELNGLKKWVAENGPLSDLPDRGQSLLREACLPGADFEGADWLLREGVDPTGPLKAGVRTPIQLADRAGCGDMVVLLLEFGAKPEHLFRDQQEPHQYILDFVKQWQAGERISRR
jgi:hypothetical protein